MRTTTNATTIHAMKEYSNYVYSVFDGDCRTQLPVFTGLGHLSMPTRKLHEFALLQRHGQHVERD